MGTFFIGGFTFLVSNPQSTNPFPIGCINVNLWFTSFTIFTFCSFPHGYVNVNLFWGGFTFLAFQFPAWVREWELFFWRVHILSIQPPAAQSSDLAWSFPSPFGSIYVNLRFTSFTIFTIFSFPHGYVVVNLFFEGFTILAFQFIAWVRGCSHFLCIHCKPNPSRPPPV